LIGLNRTYDLGKCFDREFNEKVEAIKAANGDNVNANLEKIIAQSGGKPPLTDFLPLLL